jgi:shikimate dehydrogenase
MISGKTSIYGIFGHPVEHTFSPGMHNAAFTSLGLDGCYVPFGVRPEDLGKAVKAIIPLGLCGLNITVPHKVKVIKFLDELTDDARLIGAVNTIEVRNGKLIGHNTDGRGFLRSLREETDLRPKGKIFLMVGSGGAARAVCFNLALAGADTILLHDIDRAKAEELGRDVRSATKTHVNVLNASGLRSYAPDADCIINATPLGLKKSDPLPLCRDLIGKGQLVCDLVYNPPDTLLLKTARSRGAKTLRGIGMLLYQGVIAFEIWTGKKAPVNIMKKTLNRQIGER